ncbi:hypothetical protein [Acidipropionibacterium jensenii]|uniref:hypothetical protein n=1 Tax=Acidipropionibacterium jensenii TaxID=1749 RepID=UPI000FD86B60|nr:hypothetical protein [Acidipropionibacterium jensenii]
MATAVHIGSRDTATSVHRIDTLPSAAALSSGSAPAAPAPVQNLRLMANDGVRFTLAWVAGSGASVFEVYPEGGDPIRVGVPSATLSWPDSVDSIRVRVASVSAAGAFSRWASVTVDLTSQPAGPQDARGPAGSDHDSRHSSQADGRSERSTDRPDRTGRTSGAGHPGSAGRSTRTTPAVPGSDAPVTRPRPTGGTETGTATGSSRPTTPKTPGTPHPTPTPDGSSTPHSSTGTGTSTPHTSSGSGSSEVTPEHSSGSTTAGEKPTTEPTSTSESSDSKQGGSTQDVTSASKGTGTVERPSKASPMAVPSGR